MSDLSKVKEMILKGELNSIFNNLYGSSEQKINYQIKRYCGLIDQFKILFSENSEIYLFSTPGRTEVGGNHTDHNAGRVLAASIDLDTIAVVSKNNEKRINIKSEGYDLDSIDLNDLEFKEEEKFSSSSLIRGVCFKMKSMGYEIGGFNAATKSNVPGGSGLSSSAAFEVLVVTILNHLFNDAKIDDVTNAQIAQYSENNYFCKPCGLMDQTTCAVGGFVTIDFKDFANPIVKRVEFDFDKSGYEMAIIDTGGNHADLTEDYTALENEMKAVAKALGGKVLRDFSLEKVMSEIVFLRKNVNDRAILRAVHFYNDDQRVVDQVRCLENNDFKKFLDLIIASGISSWMLCQNCYVSKEINFQGIPIALVICEDILKNHGAWRVHGGGFQGTIQAFVPKELNDRFRKEICKVFGDKSYSEIMIRPVGTFKFEI
jgi:galactokinase